MDCKISRIQVLCVVVCAFSLPLAAAELPRACHQAGPPLGANENGVVHHSDIFPFPNGKDLSFETFSLTAPNPEWQPRDPPFSHCFRYEYINTTSRTIKSFEWPDAEIHRFDLNPKERQRTLRKQTSMDDEADVDASEVWAFRASTRAITQGHFTKEHIRAKRSKASIEGGKYTYFEFAKYMPEVVDNLKQAKLRIVPIGAYFAPNTVMDFMSLETIFEATNLRFTAVSTGKFVKNRFQITTSLSAEGAEEIFVPILIGMEKNFAPPLDAKDVAVVAKGLASRKFTNISVRKYSATLSFPGPEDKKLPGLFVINHPVTIRTKDRAFCIGVFSYSPVPLSVGKAYCNDKAFR